ncbi:hypothetical protein J5N97_001167 [Dioscorea zingiberensis]|uniref:Malate dehydrogenase n=1 Tax=Dioscorea zingiberensis TaxID=325984 RepID=A0A9D5BUP5_9LILI|nr:hypothetical protein J5N97_001167 [Dioscorea zingiberensis]
MLRSVEFALRGAGASRSFAFSSAAPERKVAILGAAGGIGQPLALLMKLNPLVSRLSLHDIAGTSGVAADVSHINTPAQVAGFVGEDQLGEALKDADVVIIPAGVPRKPGMTRDDLFNINAGIVNSLCTAIAKHCPHALVNMISNPVNSTVPIAAEVFKKAGTYDEKKLFGVTTLDLVRAKTFYAGKTGLPVSDVNVPVVGGHAGITILPLFSQRTQDGGTEVVEAKAGKGSATLSMAHSKFCNMQLMSECTFMCSLTIFIVFIIKIVKLGRNGVEEVLELGSLSEYEKQGNLRGSTQFCICVQIHRLYGVCQSISLVLDNSLPMVIVVLKPEAGCYISRTGNLMISISSHHFPHLPRGDTYFHHATGPLDHNAAQAAGLPLLPPY